MNDPEGSNLLGGVPPRSSPPETDRKQKPEELGEEHDPDAGTEDKKDPQVHTEGLTSPPPEQDKKGMNTNALLNFQHLTKVVKDSFSKKKPEDGPSRIKEFSENVETCISNLNQLRKKKQGSFSDIPPFRLFGDGTADLVKWNKSVDLTEIQDWRGCFTYNPYRRLLAVWNRNHILLYQFEVKPESNLLKVGETDISESLNILPGLNSVFFSRDGANMYCVTDTSVRMINLEYYENCDKVRTSAGRLESSLIIDWKSQGGTDGHPAWSETFRVIHLGYHEGYYEGMEDLDANTLFPDYVVIYLASANYCLGVQLSFNTASNERKEADDDESIPRYLATAPVELPWTLKKKLYETFDDPKVKWRMVSTGVDHTFGLLEVKNSQLKVSSHKFKISRQRRQFLGSSGKPTFGLELQEYVCSQDFNFSVNPDIIAESLDNNGRVVLVSSKCHELYQIEFLNQVSNIEMKRIIKLPENIKRINHLSFAYHARFITMNANIGELYLWALLNDGSYGKVMYLDLDHEFTSTYITPDLDFVLSISPGHVGVQFFDPLSESLDYFTIPTATKVLLGENKDKYGLDDENFAPINNMLVVSKDLAVYLRQNQIFALDINTDERYQTEEGDESFEGHVIKSGSLKCFEKVELVPNKTWVIYLQYTKVGHNSYYEGEQSVFEIYTLTVEPPEALAGESALVNAQGKPGSDWSRERFNRVTSAEAKKYKPNIKQLKQKVTFGRVYEAVSPNSKPFNLKYADNIVIVHSQGDIMASCIKLFPATTPGNNKHQCWIMRKQFDLFNTLGIKNLDSPEGCLVLLNKDYGAVRPPSFEEKISWNSDGIESATTQEYFPGTEFEFPSGTKAAPPQLDKSKLKVVKTESPSAIHKKLEAAKHSGRSPTHSEPEMLRPVLRFIEERDLITDHEDSGTGASTEHVMGAFQLEHPVTRGENYSAIRKSIGADDKIDHDSLDEGYNEMNIEGIQNKTGSKRPAAGAWYFFRIADLLGEKEGRITVKKKVHIAHSKYAKLSPDGSLLMLYGHKGYELFRFVHRGPDKRELPMTLKEDYYKTEAITLFKLLGRHEELARKAKDPQQVEAGSVGDPQTKLKPFAPRTSTTTAANSDGIKEKGRGVLMYDPAFWVREESTPEFLLTPLRYRWKDSYKISSYNNVVFSKRVHPHEEEDGSSDKEAFEVYIAICYDSGSVQVLRQHSYKPNGPRVPRTRPQKVSNSSELKKGQLEHRVVPLNLKMRPAPEFAKWLFKFGYDSNSIVYLSKYGMSANPNNTTLDFIKLSSRTSVQAVDFDNRYLGLYLDFTIEGSEVYYDLVLRQISEEISQRHIGFKMIKSESSTSPLTIPFQTFLSRNLERYFYPRPGSQTEKFGYELLENTFRAMDPSSILQDPRVIICLMVLNKPDLIQRVIQNIGIGPLISNLPVLELVFSVSDVPRGNSIVDVAGMYQELAKNPREIPRLPEDWISSVIKSTEVEGIAASPGTKAIFSQMIFGHTGVMIEGLTKQPDLSLVKLEDDQKSVYLPPFVVKSLVNPLLMENPANSNTYDVYRTHLQLDLTNGSEFSIGLFQAILAQPDSEIRYKFRQLIMYKWRMVFYYSLVYTLVYLALNVLAYLYFGYFDMPVIGLCLAALHALFILFDVKLYGSALLISSKDLKNWIDVSVHGFSLTICIFSLLGLISNANILSYLKVIALTAVSIRGIIQLKMFSGIRALVMLMGQIIVDLAWVPFVFAGVLLLATTIYRMVPNPAGSSEAQLGFLDSAQQIFMLIFLKDNSVTSDLDTSSPAGIVRSVVLLLGGTILMQGVFNFVIAIFIQTFQRVKEDKEVYELRSLLLEIVDFDVFLRGIAPSNKEIGHYLFLVPVPKDGKVFENQTQFDRLNKMKDDLFVEIGKKGIEKVGEKAKKTFKGQEKYIDQAVGFVKDNAKETDPRIRKFFAAAEQVSQGRKPEISELTNLVSLLGDATDGKVRNVIQKTKKAAELAFDYAEKAGNGEEQSVDSLIDVLVAMADATDSGGSSIAKQIGQLSRLVRQCVDQAKELKDGRIDLPKVIDLAVDITQAFGSKDIAERVSGIAGATKCILQEGRSFAQTEKIDFESVLDKLSIAARNCGAQKIADTISQPEYKKMAKLARILLETKSNISLESIELPALIGTGCDLVNILIDDEETKTKISKLGVTLTTAAQTFGKLDFKNTSAEDNLQEVLIVTSDVIAAISTENSKVFDLIKVTCTSVRNISKMIRNPTISDVPRLVDGARDLLLQVLPDDQANIKSSITEVSKFVSLIIDQVEVMSKSQNDSTMQKITKSLPGMIEVSSKLIRGLTNDETIRRILDTTLLASKLVQSRVDSFEGASKTAAIFETSELALDLLCLISPQVKQRSKIISQSLQMVHRQYENLSNEVANIDIPLLLDDFGQLAVTIDQNAERQINQFVSLAKLLLDRYASLSSRLQNKTDSTEHIRWTCQTVEMICSEFDSDIGSRLAGYCRGIVGLVGAAQELSKYKDVRGSSSTLDANQRGKNVDFDLVFTQTAKGLAEFSDRAADVFQQAVPVFKIFASTFNRDVSNSMVLLEEGFNLALQCISRVDRSFEERAKTTGEILRGLFACLKNGVDTQQSDEPVDVEKMIDAGIGLIKLIAPEYVSRVQKFKPVATALVRHAKMQSGDGEKPSLTEIVETVATIVEVVSPDLKRSIRQVVDMGKTILSVASTNNLADIDVGTIATLVEQLGSLFLPNDEQTKRLLATAKSVILTVAKDMRLAVGIGRTAAKDPISAITPAFTLVKSVLAAFRADLSPMVIKVELTVLGLIQQLENFRSTGTVDLRSVVTWGVDMLCEYSEEIRKPARLIQGFVSVVVSTSQDLMGATTGDGKSPISWEILAEGCCQLARVSGIGSESQVLRIVRLAKALTSNLDKAYYAKEEDSLIFTPVLESIKDVMLEFRPQHHRVLTSWCVVARSLETEVREAAKSKSRTVLDTISLVGRLLSNLQADFAVHANTVCTIAKTLSEMMQSAEESYSKESQRISKIMMAFKPLLDSNISDRKVTRNYELLIKGVLMVERVVYDEAKIGTFREIVSVAGEVCSMISPESKTKLDICSQIVTLVEKQDIDINHLTKSDLELLIESVMKLASTFVPYHNEEFMRSAILIKKTVNAVYLSMQKLQDPSARIKDAASITDAAADILKLVYPSLDVNLTKFQTLIELVEEEAQTFSSTNLTDPRSMISKVQRVLSVLSPADGAYASRLAILLNDLQLLLAKYPNLQDQSRDQMLRLAFSAVAILNPTSSSKVERFIIEGLDLFESAASNDLELFLAKLKSYVGALDISGLDSTKLDQLIKSLREVLLRTGIFNQQH